jgi:hypothetical protein
LSRLGHRVLAPVALTDSPSRRISTTLKLVSAVEILDSPTGPVRAAHHRASPILSRRLVMEASPAVYGFMHHHFEAVLLDLRH